MAAVTPAAPTKINQLFAFMVPPRWLWCSPSDHECSNHRSSGSWWIWWHYLLVRWAGDTHAESWIKTGSGVFDLKVAHSTSHQVEVVVESAAGVEVVSDRLIPAVRGG